MATTPPDDNRPARDPVQHTEDPLECALIDQFLADRGHTFQSIEKLPKGHREALLRDAAQSVSLRLAEIQSRAHLLKGLDQ